MVKSKINNTKRFESAQMISICLDILISNPKNEKNI